MKIKNIISKTKKQREPLFTNGKELLPPRYLDCPYTDMDRGVLLITPRQETYFDPNSFFSHFIIDQLSMNFDFILSIIFEYREKGIGCF